MCKVSLLSKYKTTTTGLGFPGLSQPTFAPPIGENFAEQIAILGCESFSRLHPQWPGLLHT
jgi:hypothetical protein